MLSEIYRHGLYKGYKHTYIHTIPDHYITLHYTTLHYITLHYITLHYIHACIHTLHTYICNITNNVNGFQVCLKMGAFSSSNNFVTGNIIIDHWILVCTIFCRFSPQFLLVLSCHISMNVDHYYFHKNIQSKL